MCCSKVDLIENLIYYITFRGIEAKSLVELNFENTVLSNFHICI